MFKSKVNLTEEGMKRKMGKNFKMRKKRLQVGEAGIRKLVKDFF